MKNSEQVDFEISFYEKLIKDKPDFIDALIPLAEAYTKKGRCEEGLKIDKRLAKLLPDEPIIFYNLACSFALVGGKREAITALKKAIQFGYRDFNHMKRDPDLKSLHEEEVFQKLIYQKGVKT